MAAGDLRYRVVCESGRYRGKWRAERISDGKVMTESSDPVHCLRWINVWGPMRAIDARPRDDRA